MHMGASRPMQNLLQHYNIITCISYPNMKICLVTYQIMMAVAVNVAYMSMHDDPNHQTPQEYTSLAVFLQDFITD